MANHYGLLGYPLGQSLSPQIHRLLFSFAGKVDFTYDLFPRENKNQFNDLFALNGFNVTIPYKETIIASLSHADEKVALYHACNTVVSKQNGLYGYNTDVNGFLDTLGACDIHLKSKKVLVTGFGGVSKMMVTESLLAGADVTVCIRDLSRKEEIEKELYQKTGKQVTVINKPETSYEILLQGTPAGMYPNFIDSPVPLACLKDTSFAFDTIYNPLSTLITNAVNYSGGRGVNGLSMLISQAGYAQYHFYGAKFSTAQYEEVENEIKKQLPELKMDKNIILIGPPGSGKTALMEGISQIFGLKAVDTDEIIESDSGMKIKEIFKQHGETYFRKLEAKTAIKLISTIGQVISTGGGIVETAECMQALFQNPNHIILALMPSKEILLSRLQGDEKRPLLAGDMEQKLSFLLERRMPLYQKYAHIPIFINNELPIKENVLSICDKVVAYYKK